jgi:hypothetical protein
MLSPEEHLNCKVHDRRGCAHRTALHGTAMRYAAERRNLDESIEELRQIADGRNDILAEAASITPGLGMPARPLTSAMS